MCLGVFLNIYPYFMQIAGVGVVSFLAGWAFVPISKLIPFNTVSVSPVSVAHITKCLYIRTCVTVPFPVLSHFRKSDKKEEIEDYI